MQQYGSDLYADSGQKLLEENFGTRESQHRFREHIHDGITSNVISSTGGEKKNVREKHFVFLITAAVRYIFIKKEITWSMGWMIWNGGFQGGLSWAAFYLVSSKKRLKKMITKTEEGDPYWRTGIFRHGVYECQRALYLYGFKSKLSKLERKKTFPPNFSKIATTFLCIWKKTFLYECLHMLLYVWPSVWVCACVCIYIYKYMCVCFRICTLWCAVIQWALRMLERMSEWEYWLYSHFSLPLHYAYLA